MLAERQGVLHSTGKPHEGDTKTNHFVDTADAVLFVDILNNLN
jgi:hypothetical protein